MTAVEYNPDIASVYQDLYPNDTVIVGDAHEYLLINYKKFDFIWASPPCQTHSDIRRCGVHSGQCDALYPDMKLYQEIIFLQHFAPKDCKWVVENVRPYYNPLIRPNIEIHRHLFWSNFNISKIEIKNDIAIEKVSDGSTVYGMNIKKYKMPTVKYKKQILRNMVNPVLGLYVFEQMLNKPVLLQGGLFNSEVFA